MHSTRKGLHAASPKLTTALDAVGQAGERGAGVVVDTYGAASDGARTAASTARKGQATLGRRVAAGREHARAAFLCAPSTTADEVYEDASAEAAGLGWLVRRCGRYRAARIMTIVGALAWWVRTLLFGLLTVVGLGLVIYSAFLVGTCAAVRSLSVSVVGAVSVPEARFVLSNDGFLGAANRNPNFGIPELLADASNAPGAPLTERSRRMLAAVATILNTSATDLLDRADAAIDDNGGGTWNASAPPASPGGDAGGVPLPNAGTPSFPRERVLEMASVIVDLAQDANVVTDFEAATQQIENQCRQAIRMANLFACNVPQIVSWVIGAEPLGHTALANGSFFDSSFFNATELGHLWDDAEARQTQQRIQSMTSNLLAISEGVQSICTDYTRLATSLQPLFDRLPGVLQCSLAAADVPGWAPSADPGGHADPTFPCAIELALVLLEAQELAPPAPVLSSIEQVVRERVLPMTNVLRALLVHVLSVWPWGAAPPRARAPVDGNWTAPSDLPPPSPPPPPFNLWDMADEVAADGNATLDFEIVDLFEGVREQSTELAGAALLILVAALLFLLGSCITSRAWEGYGYEIQRRALTIEHGPRKGAKAKAHAADGEPMGEPLQGTRPSNLATSEVTLAVCSTTDEKGDESEGSLSADGASPSPLRQGNGASRRFLPALPSSSSLGLPSLSQRKLDADSPLPASPNRLTVSRMRKLSGL